MNEIKVNQYGTPLAADGFPVCNSFEKRFWGITEADYNEADAILAEWWADGSAGLDYQAWDDLSVELNKFVWTGCGCCNTDAGRIDAGGCRCDIGTCPRDMRYEAELEAVYGEDDHSFSNELV